MITSNAPSLIPGLTGFQAFVVPSIAASTADAFSEIEQDKFHTSANVFEDEMIVAAIRKLCSGLEPRLRPQAVYYRRQSKGTEAAKAERILPSTEIQGCDSFARVLDAACQSAQRTNTIEARQQATPARSIFAVPIELPTGDRDAIGFIFASQESSSTLNWLAQSIANQVLAWQLERDRFEADREAQETAAILELVERIVDSHDLQQACYRLASTLQSHLKYRQVAIGFRTATTSKCQLISLSGSAHFDKRSAFVSSLESLMAMSLQKNDSICWKSRDENSKAIDLALQTICEAIGAKSIVCVPFQNRDQKAIGAVALIDETFNDEHVESLRFLKGASNSISSALSAVHQSELGALSKIARRWVRVTKPWKMVAKICGALLACFAFFLPGTHRIQCQSRVEPTVCRFIAAPFDGTLEKALFEPGDLVSKGDLLARMDGREIRWKRASVLADQNQASKKRDAAQAMHNYADQQIAQLEIERLAIELQLLDHRAENLEITSPVDGIVTNGDLSRVEGAPLSIGQTLFEIAPLEQMIAEVAIPDDQIAYAAIGQVVEIRLDAYPGQTWKATISQLRPRSEIRDEANVFIAEVELDNADGRLRPGMKGRTSIVAGKRAYGWILLHEPWEYLTKKISW